MSYLLLVAFAVIAFYTLFKTGISGLSMWLILILLGLYMSMQSTIQDNILNVLNVLWWIVANILAELYNPNAMPIWHFMNLVIGVTMFYLIFSFNKRKTYN